MEENEKSSGRRGFLLGILTGAGATSAALVATRTAVVGQEGTDSTEALAGPVLYKRTDEAERYYKTLYS